MQTERPLTIPARADLSPSQRRRDWSMRKRENTRQSHGVRQALHDLFGVMLGDDESLVAALLERGVKESSIATYRQAGQISRAIAKALVIEALAGSVEAIRLIYAQTERPLPQAVEVSVRTSSLDEAAFAAMTREERLAAINSGLLSAVGVSDGESEAGECIDLPPRLTQEPPGIDEGYQDSPQAAQSPPRGCNAVLQNDDLTQALDLHHDLPAGDAVGVASTPDADVAPVEQAAADPLVSAGQARPLPNPIPSGSVSAADASKQLEPSQGGSIIYSPPDVGDGGHAPLNPIQAAIRRAKQRIAQQRA